MKNLSLAAAALALLASTEALAQDARWYTGFSAGQSRAQIHDDRIRADLTAQGEVVTTIDDEDRDAGFKLFGGRRFNRNFALEGGYFNLGKFGFTATTTTGSLDGTIKLQGLNLDAVGILPFTEKLSGLGRIGLTYTQARDTFTSTGTVVVTDPNPKNNEANYKLGLGLQYDFTPNLGLRGEWERYRINDAVGNQGDVDMLLVGLVYTFGGGKPVARAAAPAPAPAPRPVAAAVTQPTEPALVIVPVAARSQQYCSILDMQFEINQQSVQREYQAKVDRVGAFMRRYPDTTAVIEGHTDEVGSSADNLRLSQRRAESVVASLVERSGIARPRLQAVGYGETRPVSDNLTEEGKRLNRRINAVIACATDVEGILPVADRVTMALDMEFDTNSAVVRPQYRGELRQLADLLKANPGVTATVEGHTSNQSGTHAQAMGLSQRRAENVARVLADDYGVDRTRLFTSAFGETRRFAYNTSAEGRQENRRVNVILSFPAPSRAGR
jgi:OOP family OmpA-OmpF porin